MAKLLYFDSDARERFLRGVEVIEKAVVSTMGPKGHTVLMDTGNRHPISTKDGVSVGDFIDLEDKVEDMGVATVQEAARKTNKEAGDGTTTATLVVSELMKKGNELVNLKLDATEIKRGFNVGLKEVTEEIEKQTHQVESDEDILHIASISANNDPEIGGFIAQAFTQVGDGGIVSVVPSFKRDGKTSVTFSNGLEIGKGVYSSSLCNNEDHDEVNFENPKIFIYGDRLKDFEVVATLKDVVKKSPLVIFAPAYSDEFMSEFIEKYTSGFLDDTTFMVPDGTSKEVIRDNLEDLAVLTGTQIYGGINGKNFDYFKEEDLGGCKNYKAGLKKTTIIGGNGTKEDVDAHVAKLREKIEKGENTEEEAKSIYEIENLNERIAKLTGGIATIHIGASSDLEAREKKDRYDDARNAVENAIKDGIFIGGGCGLLHVIANVKKNHKTLPNQIQETGFQEYLKVLEMPARTIIGSTGKDPGYWVEKIKDNVNLNYGYNAKTEEECENMLEAGVVDPVRVIKSALRYGTSIAGAFITTNCIIVRAEKNISVIPNDPVLDRDRGIFDGEEQD